VQHHLDVVVVFLRRRVIPTTGTGTGSSTRIAILTATSAAAAAAVAVAATIISIAGIAEAGMQEGRA
jgi:hypothetical protein